jgi:hypothetical protein
MLVKPRLHRESAGEHKRKGRSVMAQNLKSGLILTEGETLVLEIEAELWASSSNPIVRFFSCIQKFIAMILGYRKSGYVVVRNKRVVEVDKIITCYCCGGGKEVKYLLPSSLKEVGFIKEATCGCFCPAYSLYFDAFTNRTKLLLKGVDEAGAQKTVDVFYRAIAQSQSGAVAGV